MRSALALFALCSIASVEATAGDFALTSRTSYRALQLRLTPSGEALRHLDRFAQSIDARLWDLGPGIDVVMSLRYDTDFGTGFRRDTPAGAGIPATDERNDLDLMYLYVEWRAILGRIDVRLGRQLILDDLDWYSLDGLRAVVHLFPGNFVELYAGRGVGFDVLLSSEPFVQDGIEVDDGSLLAFGGSLHGRFSDDLALSLAYRAELRLRGEDLEVFGRDPSGGLGLEIESGSAGKIGIQESLLGGSISYTLRAIDLEIYAHGLYNVLFADLDQARAGLAYNPTPALHVALEGLRVRPRFAGDSIFNVFNIFPYDRARAELSWEIVPGLLVEAGYFLQHFDGGPKGEKSAESRGASDPAVRGGEGLEFSGSSRVHGPSGGVSYRGERWGVGAFAEASTNFAGRIAYGGSHRRAELWGDASFLESRLTTALRLGYTGYQNDWFEGADRGDVQEEARSFAIDASLRGEIVEGVFARVRYIKRFDSVLEGDHYAASELEVRY